MAENEIQITLTAVDEASEPIKTALNGIKLGTDEVKKSAGEAGKTIQEQFKEAGRELKDFRKTLFLVTAAFAAVVATTREASKYNKEAKETYDKFTTSVTSLAATIGTALAPMLKSVTAIVNILRDVIEAAIAGFIKMFSLIITSFEAVAQGMGNIAANIKNIFTGKEDPMGIIEGFKVSFQKALEISDAAADEFLNNMERTRAQVESGVTLEDETKQVIINKKREEEAVKNKEKTEADLKKKAFADSKQLLADLAKENKTFAILNKAVAITESIINTAVGVTKALPNIPLAVLVGAIGAAQTALIASQGFSEGSANVKHLATGTDTVPAMLTPGEMVFPRSMADAIRAGDITVGGRGGGFGGGDINISLYGVTINSKENVRELAEELGFEIERQLRSARTAV